MKHLFYTLVSSIILVAPLFGADFARGADVGWLPQMEATGFRFYDSNGQPADCLQILKDHGINTVRLRVFVNPSNDRRSGHCSRDEVTAMAVRASKMGFRIMIDFQYSDTWTDPGHQAKPAAWVTHSFEQLKQDVYDHTLDVMKALKAQGVTPEWAQVGNEITNGMLWPDGKPSKGKNLADLINSGYRAVKEVDPETKVIVHLDKGSSNGLYRWFFDQIQKNGANYDVIGLSYYPSWSGTDYTKTINDLTKNLNDMVTRYGKEVMVVEVGGDDTQVDDTQAMLTAVLKSVRAVPGNKGLGVVYWEPEGARKWSGYSLSCWGADGKPTKALDSFLEMTK